MKKWAIDAGAIITPHSVIKKGSVVMHNGYIDELAKGFSDAKITLQIPDGVLCPGLINSHDHLIGNYYPKVGNGPYENWLPWDNDLKSDPTYNERQQIENRDLYLLAGYRNLISGVTSVHDHIPHFVQEPFLDLLPLKVISDYALVHSIAPFALNWGEGVGEEYQRALKEDIPFITHIAEGFDKDTVRDLETLEKKGGLGDHSVLIHGIAFSEADIRKIKAAGATVVWCGDSNMFMFDKTANIRYMLSQGVNVTIGTDSPMSGGLNLLHEMRFDRELYPKLFKGDRVTDKQLVEMVTSNAAKAFRLYENGSIETGKLADLVVFDRSREDPYDSVVSAELKNVRLVVIEGIPVYGDEAYAEIFEEHEVETQKVTIAGQKRLIIGDVLGLLERINRAVGFEKKFPFMPVQLRS